METWQYFQAGRLEAVCVCVICVSEVARASESSNVDVRSSAVDVDAANLVRGTTD